MNSRQEPGADRDLINLCLNQTLSRTILTSLTVFMVVTILYVWGGPGIHGFAFALVVGVISVPTARSTSRRRCCSGFYRKPNAAAVAAKGSAPAAG